MRPNRRRWKRKAKEETVPEQVVVCATCGHRGTETEFLKKDPADTTCPKCGADECDYEM